MSLFRNFKSVTYCVAQWAEHISEEELRVQADWLQKYVGIDKVYLETYRGSFASEKQIKMIKKVLEEYGIEVSGGITTVTPDLNESDKKRHRLFETFCYCNEPMRNRLKEVSEYTAKFFDEFIIDDFFFTQCMCQDCLREKGDRSWKKFRLAKMKEVSENLIIKPAKAVNPDIKIIIKYPNWRESYHETGYNPAEQKDIFDGIYTGTETRHGQQQDQHLPRYLSYSLPLYMENASPGRNGGGWFDPFECDRIDTYLEQAYLTAFSKCREIMTFCWPALYNNKRATPLGFQYQKIDEILDYCGKPVGTKVYIPFNSQGEDHLEDFLGMAGVTLEPTPYFPLEGKKKTASKVFLTASALEDKEITAKIRDFMLDGGSVVVSSGFVIGAQKLSESGALNPPLSEFTSIRYTDRRLDADEFQVTVSGLYGRNYIKSDTTISFPLLEHRNNASWSKVNAGHGEYHESIIMYDTYSQGVFEVINLPDMPSRIRDLPAQVLTNIRQELMDKACRVWIDCGPGVSLFTYDNDTFGLYCYTNDGCAPVDFNIHVKGAVALEFLPVSQKPSKWRPSEIKPLYTRKIEFNASDEESVFQARLIPGDFQFFRIK